MPDHLTYAPLYDNDLVVYGDAMLPNSPAAMLTYTRAIEAKAAWRATQAGKNGNEIWETFLAWRVACIGHNLTVTGRTLATFYHAPPLIRGLPPVRCYDGIVVADGKGGVTLCEPYRYCNCPDLGDMGGNIMSDHWELYFMVEKPIDRAIVQDAISRAIRHCNYLENKVYARQVRRG